MRMCDFDKEVQSMNQWMDDSEKLVHSLRVGMDPKEVTKKVQEIKVSLLIKLIKQQTYTCLANDQSGSGWIDDFSNWNTLTKIIDVVRLLILNSATLSAAQRIEWQAAKPPPWEAVQDWMLRCYFILKDNQFDCCTFPAYRSPHLPTLQEETQMNTYTVRWWKMILKYIRNWW